MHRNPGLVTSRGVLASPTLIKDLPLPKRVLVGDLSNTKRVLLALDIDRLRLLAEVRSRATQAGARQRRHC